MNTSAMHRAERGSLCGHNLGTSGQNQRLRLAAAMVFLGLALAVWMVESDAPRWVRALTFGPFFMASFGALQGLLRTCPYHAMKGTREQDDGRVDNVVRDDMKDAAKHLSKCVLVASAVLALIMTAVIVVLPS